MRRAASRIGRFGLVVAMLAMAGWGALALAFRLPLPEGLRVAAALAWAAFSLVAAAMTLRKRAWPIPLYVAACAALLVWWGGIAPRSDKDWAPDVARTVTGTVDGDSLTLHDLRDFDWRSNSDFGERWEDRSFDLAGLDSLDLINSYWSGPSIAHTLISFGFADGRHLVFSVEVRRRRGEEYSELSGFFKEDELVIIAATERDIVRVRTNVRGEDVQLFRLQVTPETARKILLAVVEKSNEVAARPRFYNTVTTNCTTVLFAIARRLDTALDPDWRILFTGYLPDYAYDHGFLDRHLPLAELRARGRINARALAADASSDFSSLIRVGVPGY